MTPVNLVPLDPRQLNALEWKQPSAFVRRYELLSGDSQLALVSFSKSLGSLAEAHTANEAWTFKRRGMLSTIVGARLLGTEQDVAVYRPNFSGTRGTIRIKGGEPLELRSTGFWSSEWIVRTEEQDVLLRFHNHGLMRSGAHVEVMEAAKRRADIGLVLTFAWYLLLLHMEDGAAAAAIC
jgi:hypothetical protein